MNTRGGWLSESEGSRGLGLLKVSKLGLQNCGASLLPYVAAMLSFLGVVKETFSCCPKGQQMALLSMQNACADVAQVRC